MGSAPFLANPFRKLATLPRMRWPIPIRYWRSSGSGGACGPLVLSDSYGGRGGEASPYPVKEYRRLRSCVGYVSFSRRAAIIRVSETAVESAQTAIAQKSFI